MHSFVSFRLTSHVCLYSALLCLFNVFQTSWQCFALLIALSLLACFLAVNCRLPALRLLCGLLPLLALLVPVHHWAVTVAVALAVVYLSAFLISGRFLLEVWKYRPEVVILLVVSLILAVASQMGDHANPVPAPMCLACVVCAFLALRAMRLGGAASAGWQLACAGEFFLPVAASAATVGVIMLVWPLLGVVFSKLGALFGWFLYQWNSFWDKTMHLATIVDSSFAESDSIPWESEQEMAVETVQSITGSWRLLQKDFPWGIVVLFVLGAALLVLVAWLLWRSRPAVGKKPDPGMVEVKAERENVGRRKRHARRARQTNRDLIRDLYREYLRFLSIHGVCLKRSATTEEITAASAAILTQTDELLRALYRKVRYSTAEPTDEEVARAKMLLDQLVQDENLIRQGAHGERSGNG